MEREPALFHPTVRAWFNGRFGAPTVPQSAAWPAIAGGKHTLIAAPTGSGKTLAAFLATIDALVRRGLERGSLPDETQVVYVSPLKALSNDIHRNLEEPLAGIRAELEKAGLPPLEIRTLVRTGDTPARDRVAMGRRPPHLLVTTPESLFILLTSEGGRRMLRTARTLIVDEIHAVAEGKRGSHLALSMERLEALVGGRLQRIGLSATQKPVEEMARLLVGASAVEANGTPRCHVVDVGHRRDLDLAIEVPRSPLETVMSHEVWGEVYDRVAELIQEHETTLVFVNTRRLAERVTRHLSERLGDGRVASHHGSLSREQRHDAERRLKEGSLAALVATASLEMGIDVGSVDLVCQLGSTRAIATALQRVGRSGHALAKLPKGRLFPTSLDELEECVALLDAIRRGELERLEIPEAPLDILAQQIVAATASEEWSEDALYELARRAWPYRALPRERFDAVVRMLAEGFHTRRGRSGALVHRDGVNGRLRGRRFARLAAITSGGAIPDTADYRVVLEPGDTFLGTVNEDFAIESQAGDIFQLGNAAWRIVKLEQGRLRVEDARGQTPSIPFWLGEAPGRSAELSAAVSRLRQDVEGTIERAQGEGQDPVAEVSRTLASDLGLSEAAASQLGLHLAASRAALGILPTQARLAVERFFDEAGDTHLVIHSPNGSRLNRAWGLALRKRFCRKFNFELQAAATEDAILLSLGPTHSFPLEDILGFLRRATAREVLTQALLDAPMFPVRWRWNASRALAILRFRGGRRVPPRLQRQQAEDLIAVVFPDQLACAENIPGEREIPDHPLVRETIRDCLEEAMDVNRFERLLESLESGETRVVFRELTEPSPLARGVLNARPYAFLDDAPLEERRAHAVAARRFVDAETAQSLGALDEEAIARVRRDAWPSPRDADELHDALMICGFLTGQEGRASGWERPFLLELLASGRATRMSAGDAGEIWVATERLAEMRAIHPDAALDPEIAPLASLAARSGSSEEALVEILRGRLEVQGPIQAPRLAAMVGVSGERVQHALVALEVEGTVMQGRFSPSATDTEWCDRRLLARIHRATLERLRREIAPVTKVDFMRFLLAWHRVLPGERAEGADGLAPILAQLEGFEAPAAAWEGEILPSRLEQYDPAWLDAQCLSGRFLWCRVSARGHGSSLRRSGPVRTTPIAILKRENARNWTGLAVGAERGSDGLTVEARAVLGHLRSRGASFFAELVQASALLPTQVEDALAELVASGLASADSFTGLRALLTPSSRRPLPPGGKRKGSVATFGMESAGRWFLVSRAPAEESVNVEAVAWALLHRYGIVFRRILDREAILPPWRDLLRVYRRAEARGELRGGRFVDGFAGEQYALPEAVGRLRALRRSAPESLVSVSAADPLNLTGIVTPGDRVPALAGNRILYRDGLPIAVLESGKPRFLVELEPAVQWEMRHALVRRRVPARLRAYLGRSA